MYIILISQVKADAVSSDDSASMSSDDEDFNPDELEAKSAKEEYDSDPSDTGWQNIWDKWAFFHFITY